MIKYYLKIALRNLMKYKFISFINLFGLTVGITCCLLITAYIINEKSYDRFNPKASQIYRVTRSFNTLDGAVNLHLSSRGTSVGPLLQHEFPDINYRPGPYLTEIPPLNTKRKCSMRPRSILRMKTSSNSFLPQLQRAIRKRH